MFLFRWSVVERWIAILLAGACLGVGAEEVPQSGEPVERTIAGGEVHRWTLELSAGDFLELVVEQRRLDVSLELFDPQGAQRTRLDSPVGDDEPEKLLEVAPTSGTYRLEIRPLKSNAKPGRYAVRPPLRRPATETDRLLVDADRLQRRAHELRRSKDFEGAIVAYREALELWRRLDQPRRQAETLQGLARAFESKNDLETAVEHFERALELAPAFADPKLEAQLLQGLGLALRRQGKNPEAIAPLERARRLFEQVEDARGTALTLSQLGGAYFKTGRIQHALDCFEQALALRPNIESQISIANILVESVPVLLALDRSEQALEHAEEALEIYRRGTSAEKITTGLKTLADAALRAGHYELAERSIRAALERLAPAEVAQRSAALNTFGLVRLRNDDPVEARSLFTEALRLAREAGEPSVVVGPLVYLGHLDRLEGQAEQALALQDEALAVSRAAQDPMGEATSRVRGAQALRDLGRLDEAWHRLQPALELVEELRSRPEQSSVRARYFAFRQEYYEIAWDVLMRLEARDPTAGYSSLAFLVNERRLARELLDALAAAPAATRYGIAPELLEREQLLEREIRLATTPGRPAGQEAEARRQLEALLFDLDKTRSEIRKANPRYAALAPARPLDLEQIRQSLASDTLLLVYALGEEASYLWALDGIALTAHVLPPRAGLERLARRFAERLTQRSSAVARARDRDARELATQLLGPIASRLTSQRLVVVAEGDLQLVPFAALPEPASVAGGAPLIVRHEIITLPSISVLDPLRRERAQRAPSPERLAVFADPVFNRRDPRLAGTILGDPRQGEPTEVTRGWPEPLEQLATRLGLGTLERLEGSTEEGRAILALAGGRGFLAAGFDASRERLSGLVPGRFSVLHFATHALPDREHPELSGLALSLFDERGEPQDGFLRAFEISRLQLPMQLVVLSACQTGVGLDVRGEGMLGLTRSFLHAGALGVVASLWPVDDRATSKLMGHFYRSYLQEGKSVASALRLAQIAMLEQKETATPYYWAAFIFQGDWQ